MKNLIKERQKDIVKYLIVYVDMPKDIAMLVSEYDYWIVGKPTILKRVSFTKVMCIEPLFDGSIVAGYSDFSLKIWNPDTINTCSNVICILTGHNDWVACVRESPDNSCGNIVLYSGSYDETIKIWTIDNNYQYKCETIHMGSRPTTIEILEQPSTRYIISGDADGKIKICCLETLKVIKILDDGLMKKIVAIQVLTNDKICCIKEYGDKIIMWNLKSEKVENEYKIDVTGYKWTICCIRLLSNKMLTCGLVNGVIIMIDIFATMVDHRDNRIIDYTTRIGCHDFRWNEIQNIIQLPDERLVSYDNAGNIKIWDIEPTRIEIIVGEKSVIYRLMIRLNRGIGWKIRCITLSMR